MDAVEDIAQAAITSQRTLYRAFVDLMGEPPQNYIRRLRLHRIRHDLVSDAEAACTIAMVAHQWGIGEPGRLSGWYRDLFGELLSQTLARQKTGAPSRSVRPSSLAGSA
jgi:transcriptional regulator GlxA family with amidase domain